MITQNLLVGSNPLEVLVSAYNGDSVDSAVTVSNFTCSLTVNSGKFGVLNNPSAGVYTFDRSTGSAGDSGTFTYSATVTIADPTNPSNTISETKTNSTQVTLVADPLASVSIQISFK